MLVLMLHLMAGHLVGQSDHLDDAVREQPRSVRLVDAGQQYRELVAAQPRHRVAVADAGLQPFGYLLQQVVAHRMAQRVVDLLEVVEVEEE